MCHLGLRIIPLVRLYPFPTHAETRSAVDTPRDRGGYTGRGGQCGVRAPRLQLGSAGGAGPDDFFVGGGEAGEDFGAEGAALGEGGEAEAGRRGEVFGAHE